MDVKSKKARWMDGQDIVNRKTVLRRKESIGTGQCESVCIFFGGEGGDGAMDASFFLFLILHM